MVQDGLVDESVDPALEAGVSQLIEQRQLEHQDRFLQTEALRVSARSQYSQQERLRQVIGDRLSLLSTDSQKSSIIR